MSIQKETVNKILFAALLLTTAGVTIGFSRSLIRGYVVIRFTFLIFGASLFTVGILANFLADKKSLEKNLPFFGVLGGQFLALGVSVAVSIIPWVSLLGSIPRMMGALTYWACLLTAAGTVLAVEEKLHRFLMVLRLLMILSIIIALHAFFELTGVRGFRPPGLLGNPDFLGNWLVVIVLTGFGLMLTEKKRGWVLLSGAGASLGLIALVFSQTRGAWLGLGVSIFTAMIAMRFPEHSISRVRKRTNYWTAATLLSLFALLFIYEFWGQLGVREFVEATRPGATNKFYEKNLALFHNTTRSASALSLLATLTFFFWIQIFTRWRGFRSSQKLGVLGTIGVAIVLAGAFLFTTQKGEAFRKENLRLEFKNEGRTIIWRDTMKMVPDYWYKGCGIETFRVAFLPYKSIDLAINGPKQNWRNPHNVVLHEITSNGILGLMAYLLLIGYAISRFLKAKKKSKGSDFDILITGCFASFCGYLIHNLVNYDVLATAFAMYLMVGLAQAGWLIVKESKHLDTQDPPNKKQKTTSSKKKKDKKRRTKERTAKKSLSNFVLSKVYQDANLAMVSWFIPFGAGILFNNPGKWWVLWLFITPAIPLIFLLLKEISSPKSIKENHLIKILLFSALWLPTAFLVIGPLWLAQYMRKDIFPLLLSVVILSAWFLFSLRGDEREKKQQKDPEPRKLSNNSIAIISCLGIILLSLSSIYSGKHIINDWGLQRAKEYSKAVDSKLLPNLERIRDGISNLKKRIKQAQNHGAPNSDIKKADLQLTRLQQKMGEQKDKINELKKRVLDNGRRGTKHLSFMGFFRHQYSKTLQPFLRQPGTIPEPEAESLMMEAVSHAQAAPKNNTNPESAYSHLAVMHYWSIRFCKHDPKNMTQKECKKHRFEKAKAALKKSMDHDPFYYDTHRMSAFMLAREGKLTRAAEEIRIAKKIIKNRLHRYKSVAQVDRMIKKKLLTEGLQAAKKGQYQEALIAYEEGMNRYGAPMPEAYHLIGAVNLKMKNKERAERNFLRALELNGKYSDAIRDLARLRFMEKRYKEGYDLLDKLLEPRVKDPDALILRAWALESQGKIQSAIEELKLFLKVAPKSRKALQVRQEIRKLSSHLIAP